MSTVLRHTLFPGRTDGHGGFRRSAQIAELANAAGVTLAELTLRYDLPKWRARLTGLRVTLAGEIEHTYESSPWLNGALALAWSHALANHAGVKVFLWENTREFALPTFARRHGFKVIAVPHNLESFVDSAVLNREPKRFARTVRAELTSLAAADHVFCIAREDQWLLRAAGIAADYLPYFPPHALRGWLESVRLRRACATAKHFLVTGTAGNTPTADGMRVQLRCLRELGPRLPPVVVAGYGTEMLAAEFAGTPIVFRGEVSQDELAALLVETRAVLVHQESGTGALTRIPEMLLAGIPVIANRHAARSTADFTGVAIYDSPSEFGALLESPAPVVALPSEPAADFRRFHNTLRRSAGLST